MNDGTRTSLRLDKWLWAARFFKTRSLATEAVSGGKVHVGDKRVKPARPVSAGDTVSIRKGSIHWEVVVRKVSAQRGAASDAARLYEESPHSIERRAAEAERRRLARQERLLGPGRPSRGERRDLMRLKRLPD